MMSNLHAWLRLSGLGCALLLLAGLAPVAAQDEKVKSPELKHAMDLSVRKAGMVSFKDAPKVGVEVFLDPNVNKLVYISDTGSISAVAVGSYDKDKEKAPESKNAMDLRVRKAGQADFTPETPKFGVEVFQEPTTKNIIFISETGSISVVPNRPEVKFTGKNPEWLHAMILKARPGGKKEFDESCPTFGVEVFYDPNTNCLIYINEKGDLAVTPGKSTTPKEVATPELKHAIDVKVREAGKSDFNDMTPRTGIEVFFDPNSKQLIAISDKGKLALPGQAAIKSGDDGKAPPWKHGLDLRVRKAGQTKIEEAQKYGVEVYTDDATGCMLYITQTGSISFVK